MVVKEYKIELQLLEELVSEGKALGIQDYQVKKAVTGVVRTTAAECVGVHAASAVVAAD